MEDFESRRRAEGSVGGEELSPSPPGSGLGMPLPRTFIKVFFCFYE